MSEPASRTKDSGGIPREWLAPSAVGIALALVAGLYLLARFSRDVPVGYEDPIDHFKYGSTGGERVGGIPLSIFRVLPRIFPQYLPDCDNGTPSECWSEGRELEAFGFVYEEGKTLPMGFSQRNVMGITRVFVNCASCHVGTVRETPESEPTVYLGMPAHGLDLEGFERFLFTAATDEGFTAQRLGPELDEDFINRWLLGSVGIALMRDRLLTFRHRLRYLSWQEPAGLGRVDTFSPAKALLNFPLDKIPTDEWSGSADFPAIWQQRKKQGMHLHWDGNNSKVEERNRSAAFGTGAYPPTLDRPLVRRTEAWLLDVEPPVYPFAINAELAAAGEGLYRTYCADCHGKSGRDFRGAELGQLTDISEIQTDRRRLDSYSHLLSAAQNSIYAGYPSERFSHFRKTNGYANAPLDGIWLRAPYLHNGSVPTLRDLLNARPERPSVFYRGYDVYDQQRVGFVSEEAAFCAPTLGSAEPCGPWDSAKDGENGPRRYYRFDTASPGNSNSGHEGSSYGTSLSEDEKDAIVEHLKTF